MDEDLKCIKCGVVLTDKNWYPSWRKRNKRTCSKCIAERSKNWYLDNTPTAKQKHSDWKHANKERVKTTNSEWYMKNRGVVLTKQKEYNRLHMDEKIKRDKLWYLNNKEKVAKKGRDWNTEIKNQAIYVYSKGMMCCADPFRIHEKPFKYAHGLTLDHINNDGAKERRILFGNQNTGGGHRLYRNLKKRGWPKGYQVLCWTCQWLKRMSLIREDFLDQY